MTRCTRFTVIGIFIVAAVSLVVLGSTTMADRTPEQAAKYAAPVDASKLMASERPEKPATAPEARIKHQPSVKAAGAQEGGEDCAGAVVIGGLPYTDQGFTCDNADDHNAACPYTTPGSPDVVYSFTPGSNINVDITLCDPFTDYDTKLYVFETSCGTYDDGSEIACNDDAACNDPNRFVSELINVGLTGGNTYYIVVDGYGATECGNYQIDISENTCAVTCPGGATAEGEGCGLANDVNGGCNLVVPAYGTVDCGEVICGTAWTEFDGLDDLRDTDWFEHTFTEPNDVVWSGTANFPFVLIVAKVNDCGTFDVDIIASGSGGPCDVVDVNATVCAGTYVFFVAPSVFNGLECVDGPWEYVVELQSCTPGAALTNDDCVDAEAIGDVVDFPFSTACASFDGPGACLTSPNIWYCYTAECDGDITVSLCGSSYDTKLAVYDGCSCPPGGPASFNRQGQRAVAAGTQGGGEDCGSATVIGGLPYSDAGTTSGFADDYNEECPYTPTGAPDVVYSYTPGSNETVDITLCNGSAYDTKLYVYESTCEAYNSGLYYACNDDACPGFVSEILGLNLTGGNTYYIVIDGYSAVDEGSYQLDITVPAPDPFIDCNDDACGLQSEITFPAIGGNTYLIEVGGYSSNTGEGIINISNSNFCGGAIPTLSEWGMIVVGLILLGFLAWYARRRKTVLA